MSSRRPPVSEAELHAYLDGELTPGRIAAVEAHFLEDDADAARFGAYRRQSDLMRRVYGKIDAQPLAGGLLPADTTQATARPVGSGRRGWLLALVVLLGLGAGGAAGWFGREVYEQTFAPDTASATSTVLDEALAAHQIGLGDRPAEVEVMGGAGRSTLDWLAREFGFSARNPTLPQQGFEIAAGRLVPSPAGIAAHLLLRDLAGERLSLYVRPGGAEAFTGFRTPPGTSEPMVAWQAGGASLVLVGDLPGDRLRRIAGAIQSSLVAPASRSDEDT